MQQAPMEVHQEAPIDATGPVDAPMEELHQDNPTRINNNDPVIMATA